MVVHNPVADSFVVGHNLVGDSLVEGILAVGHTPVANNLDTLHLGVDSPAAVHTPVADNSRDSLAAVDSPAVLCSVADIAAFHPVADNFAAAHNLAADNFAAADSSFGFVRAAAVLLPVVRNTCKTALRPATAGNNVYNALLIPRSVKLNISTLLFHSLRSYNKQTLLFTYW